MLDKSKKHTKNGLVMKQFLTRSGHSLTISIATGIEGEVSSIITRDNNLYPDSDSRSDRHGKDYIIPLSTEDLIKLRDKINKAIKIRNLTLKK